jgi:hypothetical protein
MDTNDTSTSAEYVTNMTWTEEDQWKAKHYEYFYKAMESQYMLVIRVYVTVFVCTFGIVGNVLSMVVLGVDRSLRPSAPRLLLQMLAVADTAVLVTSLFYMTLNHVIRYTNWLSANATSDVTQCVQSSILRAYRRCTRCSKTRHVFNSYQRIRKHSCKRRHDFCVEQRGFGGLEMFGTSSALVSSAQPPTKDSHAQTQCKISFPDPSVLTWLRATRCS